MTAAKARRGAWRALAVSQALALAFLGACLYFVWREIELVLPANLVTGSFGFQEALHSRLGWQLGGFFAALVICHSLLGLAAFGLARLTRAAFPRIESEVALTVAWFVVLAGLVLAANTTLFPASIFAGTDSWWRGRFAGLSPVAIAALALGAFCL